MSLNIQILLLTVLKRDTVLYSPNFGHNGLFLDHVYKVVSWQTVKFWVITEQRKHSLLLQTESY